MFKVMFLHHHAIAVSLRIIEQPAGTRSCWFADYALWQQNWMHQYRTFANAARLRLARHLNAQLQGLEEATASGRPRASEALDNEVEATNTSPKLVFEHHNQSLRRLTEGLQALATA